MGKYVGHFFGLMFQIYFGIAVLIFVPYYNWQYANENGFTDWLFFGEVVPTAKAMVWPYFVFLKKTNKPIHEKYIPDISTPKLLDEYVAEVNKQTPLNGPDNITITGLSRNGNTLIYEVVAQDIMSSETSNLMNSMASAKYMVCNQREEFFLSKGYALSWNYFDSQKKYFGNISITPQDCILSYFDKDPKGSYFQFLENNVFPKNYRLKNGDYSFPYYKNISYDAIKSSCAINGLEQLRYDYPKIHMSKIIETTQENEFNEFRHISTLCFMQSWDNLN